MTARHGVPLLVVVSLLSGYGSATAQAETDLNAARAAFEKRQQAAQEATLPGEEYPSLVFSGLPEIPYPTYDNSAERGQGPFARLVIRGEPSLTAPALRPKGPTTWLSRATGSRRSIRLGCKGYPETNAPVRPVEIWKSTRPVCT